ncbi:hypothetical protein NCPPB3923_01625 [Burkholderia glumae]|nr:hypothetical protein NCPPB3923_01625 [Burkholderia glumae]
MPLCSADNRRPFNALAEACAAYLRRVIEARLVLRLPISGDSLSARAFCFMLVALGAVVLYVVAVVLGDSLSARCEEFHELAPFDARDVEHLRALTFAQASFCVQFNEQTLDTPAQRIGRRLGFGDRGGGSGVEHLTREREA